MTTVQPLQASPSCISPHNSPLQALQTCSSMSELKQHHSQIIKLGLSADNNTIGRVIKFCSLSEYGDLSYAFKVFNTLQYPDAFVYNTIIKGFLKWKMPRNCILLYSRMLQDSVMPNEFTFPAVVRACSDCNAAVEGKQVHGHILKSGYGVDVYALNNLIHMYMSFQYLEEARRVFDRMPCRNVVSWTTLITGYSQWGFVDETFEIFESMPERNSVSWNVMVAAYVQSNRFHEALCLFDRMRRENVGLNKFLAASILTACTGLGALKQGVRIHEYIRKSGIELDTKLATSIMDMYCKCGCLEKAIEVFNELSHREISTWNCMIGGLAIHGKGEAAVELFKEMERTMLAPDHITFVNVLSACAHSGLVDEGRYYIHYMRRVHGLEPRAEHYGCMVDLLGRVGLLEEARSLIHSMPTSPDASVLGALVGACQIHGNVELGEEIGMEMIELEPNNSGRYVALANLYTKAGRLEDATRIRRLMDDRGVKKVPGFSMIELQGVINEFKSGGRDHPESRNIYDKVDEILKQIRCVGYVQDIDGQLLELDEEEKENSLRCHSEKLAIAYGLLKSKPGDTLRILKNLRICRDCHQASKLISKVYNREIIIRDRNRFHHFKEGECSCKDCW